MLNTALRYHRTFKGNFNLPGLRLGNPNTLTIRMTMMITCPHRNRKFNGFDNNTRVIINCDSLRLPLNVRMTRTDLNLRRNRPF